MPLLVSVLLSLVELPSLTDGCTAMAIGRSATIEGSGFVAQTNDCAECDPRVAFVAAKDFDAGTMRPVLGFRHAYPRVVGTDRSPTYAALDGQFETEPIGHIDQVRHTFAYWEATYPMINEHGLGFGESTCGGKLIGQSSMEGGEAMFCVGELMRVALERCSSARCAISLMGELAQQYGFYGEDPGLAGAGEAVTVVDNSETWVFHITGGLRNTSATWVAQRVLDDHVAVIANNFIIRAVDCNDTANFLCSDNIFSNARDMQLCDFATEKDFDWLRCYSPDVRTYQYNPTSKPIPYYTTLRLWRLQSLANAEATVALTDDPYAFPFSVPVAKKISRKDVMNWYRDHYKGTPYDMTQGVLAGPHGNPNREEGGVGASIVPGQSTRGISIMRTNTAVVIEGKSGDLQGQSIAWLAVDQPMSSVFAPFIATADQSAPSYHRGHQERFSRDSAFWAFNFVSNWMMLNWEDMMSTTVGPAQAVEQDRILAAVESLEAQWPDTPTVNEVQHGLQASLVSNWWALADELVARYSDGIYTHENTTKANLGYPAWWLQMIGYDQTFYKVQWVQPSVLPPRLLWGSLPWFAVPVNDLLASASDHSGALPVGVVPAFFGALFGAFAMSRLQGRRQQASTLSHVLLQ